MSVQVFEGRAKNGRTVRMDLEDIHNDASVRICSVRIWIDGEEAEIERCEVRRDGGTRRYHTNRGVVICPRSLEGANLTPLIDGSPIT